MHVRLYWLKVYKLHLYVVKKTCKELSLSVAEWQCDVRRYFMQVESWAPVRIFPAGEAGTATPFRRPGVEWRLHSKDGLIVHSYPHPTVCRVIRITPTLAWLLQFCHMGFLAAVTDRLSASHLCHNTMNCSYLYCTSFKRGQLQNELVSFRLVAITRQTSPTVSVCHCCYHVNYNSLL